MVLYPAGRPYVHESVKREHWLCGSCGKDNLTLDPN